MYHGKTQFTSGRGIRRRILVARRPLGDLSPGEAAYQRASAPKSDPRVTAYQSAYAPQSEISPNIYGRQVPNTPYPPDEYDIQEIVVSGTRIPWWMWGLGGVLAFAAVNSFVRK